MLYIFIFHNIFNNKNLMYIYIFLLFFLFYVLINNKKIKGLHYLYKKFFFKNY